MRDEAGPACPRPTARVVYRIVQEGLTNARSHAPGTLCPTVAGKPGRGAYRGPNPLADRPDRRSSPGSGAGMIGLAERVHLVGGRLDTAAPRPAATGSGRRPLAGVSMTRVLIVDDDALVRSALSHDARGRDDVTVVGEAGDGEAVRPWSTRTRPTSCSWTSACRVRRAGRDAALPGPPTPRR